MNRQAVSYLWPQLAVASPCHDCDNFGTDKYTDCSSWCHYLNAYLIFLGDKPHVKPDKKILKLFITPKHQKAGYCVPLCTPEQYKEARKKLLKIQKKYPKMQKYQLAAMIGISDAGLQTTLRNTKKRMAIESYNKIMEFYNNLDTKSEVVG